MLADVLKKPYWALRLAFGLVPVVAGADKFLNLLTNWQQYLSPLVRDFVPAATFMQAVGVIEIVAGLIVLSKYTRIGAYIVSLWLVGIALNLLTTGQYLDVAVRDLVMAAGAFTLARLEEVRLHQTAREPVAVAGIRRAAA